MPAARTLIVVRHAEAARPHGVADFDRPLTDAGRADAARTGAQLAAAPVDAVLCSPSRRTRETLDQIAKARAGILPAATFDPRIYEAGAEDLLKALGGLPPDAMRAMLVGHNPGLPGLIDRLGRRTEVERLPAFTPGAFVVLEIDGPWRAPADGACGVGAFFAP